MTAVEKRIAKYTRVFSGLLVWLLLFACGEKAPRYNTNLLKNSSFEDIKDGLPKHWHLEIFRGMEGDKEVEFGIDKNISYDGEASFFFTGDKDTRLWRVLSQEVEVENIRRIRLRGAMRLENAAMRIDQFAQCNFLISFYDQDHHRFIETRFADKRTRVNTGTMNWFVEEKIFRVPNNTRYIEVHCVLGMSGTVWFDELSLEIPKEAPWLTNRTKNFTFHWLPKKPFPPDYMEAEQRLFDYYCERLGVTSDEHVDYYLYPDSATIKDMLGLKGVFYVSWDDREIHTILPYENHEIVHIITDPFGMPPRSICEGTVFYLQGGFMGQPLHVLARRFLAEDNLPHVAELVSYNRFTMLPPEISLPAAGSFVAFITETYGVDQLIELYRVARGVNAYGAFNNFFNRVYGFSADEAEIRWKQFLIRGAFAKPDSERTRSVEDASE